MKLSGISPPTLKSEDKHSEESVVPPASRKAGALLDLTNLLISHNHHESSFLNLSCFQQQLVINQPIRLRKASVMEYSSHIKDCTNRLQTERCTPAPGLASHRKYGVCVSALGFLEVGARALCLFFGRRHGLDAEHVLDLQEECILKGNLQEGGVW
jgi:hypothetical protein